MAEVGNIAEDFAALVERAIAQNAPDAIDDAALSRHLIAAIRAYAFKTEKAGDYREPYARGAVTATETAMATTAMLRAADLNLWDLAMWFNRAGSSPRDEERGAR